MSLRRVCTWLLVLSYVSYQADSNTEGGKSGLKGLQPVPLGVRTPTQQTLNKGHLSEENRRDTGEEQQSWSVAEQKSKLASTGF